MTFSNYNNNDIMIKSQHINNIKLKILLLGDGDFSWSYDFARYLKMKQIATTGSTGSSATISNITNNTDNKSNDNNNNNNNNNNISSSNSKSSECDTIQETSNSISYNNDYNCGIDLCVSGIDSEYDIEKKYPHSKSFIIPQLLKLNNDNNDNNSNKMMLTVQVKYNINAIVIAPPPAPAPPAIGSTSTSSTCTKTQQLIGTGTSTSSTSSTVNSTTINKSTTSSITEHYNIVMFHHPHLGIEDCIVHNQFLHHFFYSVRNHWWSKSNSNSSSNSSSCSGTENNNVKLLYITLASGQYERWKCNTVANKCNFLLLQRCQFVAQPSIIIIPSSSTNDKCTNADDTTTTSTEYFTHYYKHRRHQTGKSFAKRVVGNSETFIYTDLLHPTTITDIPFFDLPWFVVAPSSSKVSPASCATNVNTIISCPYCQKVFQEFRSLKNHILNKHNNNTGTTCTTIPNTNETSVNSQPDDIIVAVTDSNKRSKIDTSTSDNQLSNTNYNFVCLQCFSTTGHSRSFSTKEGLDDHRKAKHNAIHTNLSPDDKNLSNGTTTTTRTVPNDCLTNNHKTTTTSTSTEQCETIGNEIIPWKCNICDYTTTTTTRNLTDTTIMEQEHWQRFIPIKVLDGMTTKYGTVITNNFICQFCNKVFYQNRARLQHENFCTLSKHQQQQ